MRIIAGQHRGTHLADLGKGDDKAHLRPTSDRVRESVFSILTSGKFGNVVVGARVLDLFAGTGALGLEALSRGARQVTFVDNGKTALGLLRQNIAKLGRAADTRVISKSVQALPAASDPCKLVFLDPPYGQSLGGLALTNAHSNGWIEPGAIIAWEEQSPQQAPSGFIKLDQRRFGETWFSFLEAEAP